MQISKTVLTFGTAALCFVATSARAVDTEADLKLREALRQKMAEVGPETTEPAPVKPAKPAKAVKPPKPAAPVAPATPKVAAPVAPAEPAPVAPPPVTPPPAKKPAAPVVATPVVVEPAPVAAPAQPAAPAPVDEAQAERLREAVRARLAQEAGSPAQPQPIVTHGSDLEPAVSTTKIVAPPATPVQPEVTPSAQPPVVQAPKAPVTLEAPALPISGSKEARLAALLQQYKADQITPQQYHEQRAKILAE